MTCPPHHYIIEPAAGTHSSGTCRLCGVEKQFLNAIPEDRHWYSRPSKDQEEKDASREMAEAKKADELDNISYPYLPPL